MGARLFSPRSAEEIPASPRASAPERPVLSHGRFREAASLLLFASAAFIALALASFGFDPDNPNFHGSDWVGAAGSLVAGTLVQGFGVVAWLAPLELALIGRPLIRGRMPDNLGLRIAGDLVVAIVLSALCQVALPDALVFGHAGFAGNVGLLFGEMMREAFSTVGSFLVGPTVVGLILIGRSSFSFIEWARRFAAFVERLSARLSAASQRFGGAWATARALRKQEKLDHKAPAIVPRDPDAAIMIQLEDDDSDWIPMEETAAPPLALSEALRKAAASRAISLHDAETPLTRAGAAVREAASADVAALSSTPPPENAEKRKRNRGRRAKDKEVESAEAEAELETESEADEESASDVVSSGVTPDPEPSAPPKKPRKPRSTEPEIVDTQHERAVEKPAETVVVRVRDDFRLPSCELLEPVPVVTNAVSEELLKENGQLLMKTLLDYGVQAHVQAILPGPTVTMYEVSCEAGTKVSKVAALADDLALGLSRKVRIIAPIPGKNRIGFELPNEERIPVSLRELVEDQRFDRLAEKAPLPVVLGRDIVGKPFYADLASMPHVIVAGATGAGKSVGLNVMLSSLLFKRTPQELRMLMIDPKVVELAPFDGIPHMLLPVVTDMKQAATALRWAVDEMERRYQLFANAGTKNIGTYNAWVKKILNGELPPPKPDVVQAVTHDGAVVDVPADKNGADGVPLPAKLPFIVVVVDEFADLMMQQGKDVEASVARLAQKARAAGMHVVLATQRPSVDVITGMIKANFPTRIAFRVAQKVDSRTILDEQGAEHLLGRGDMLVKLNGSTETYRVQCPFVSEDEVSRLTDYLRAQGTPEYNDAILRAPEDDTEDPSDDEPLDSRFDEAVRIVAETQRCSTSWLQRKMTIGYNRAAKIVEMMEKQGMVGPPNGARDRQVFLPPPS
jgi:S-DNA-T family DNA segregation ATPase FtsK/SpoIIIE